MGPLPGIATGRSFCLPQASGLVSMTSELTGHICHPSSSSPSFTLKQVKREILVEVLTKRKTVTANDKLILPYSLSEVSTAPGFHRVPGPTSQAEGGPKSTGGLFPVTEENPRGASGSHVSSSSAQTSIDSKRQPKSQNLDHRCSSLCSGLLRGHAGK